MARSTRDGGSRRQARVVVLLGVSAPESYQSVFGGEFEQIARARAEADAAREATR